MHAARWHHLHFCFSAFRASVGQDGPRGARCFLRSSKVSSNSRKPCLSGARAVARRMFAGCVTAGRAIAPPRTLALSLGSLLVGCRARPIALVEMREEIQLLHAGRASRRLQFMCGGGRGMPPPPPKDRGSASRRSFADDHRGGGGMPTLRARSRRSSRCRSSRRRSSRS